MKKTLNLKHPNSVLRKQMAIMHPFDLAHYFIKLNDDEQIRVFELINLNVLDEFLIELPSDTRIFFFERLTPENQLFVLKRFKTDELKLFLSDFDQEDQKSLMSKLPIKVQKLMTKMLTYEKMQAANFMSTDFLTIQKDLTVAQATQYVTNHSSENDFIETIFVLDDDYQLYGQIDIKDLIVARKKDSLIDIIDTNYIWVNLGDTIEKVVSKIANYDVNVIAVTEDKVLIGIITADDVMSFVVDDYESDVEKLTGVGDYELDTKPTKRAKQRILWLIISITLNLVIAGLLSVFGQTLESITALILFQPMILGMAGNIGTQAIAVTILGLHQDSFNESKIIRKHIRKEITIGFINSFLVGLAGFIVAFIFLTVLDQYTYALSLSLTIGFSLFGSMILSSLVGVFIPIFLKKVKIDPAAASGPLISTFNDFFALFIYFGLATLLLL